MAFDVREMEHFTGTLLLGQLKKIAMRISKSSGQIAEYLTATSSKMLIWSQSSHARAGGEPETADSTTCVKCLCMV